jgi:hypothetical protein
VEIAAWRTDLASLRANLEPLGKGNPTATGSLSQLRRNGAEPLRACLSIVLMFQRYVGRHKRQGFLVLLGPCSWGLEPAQTGPFGRYASLVIRGFLDRPQN